MKTLHFINVYLASSEWGNEIMRQVAAYTAQTLPINRPLLVCVIEHAGWFLSYYFAENTDGIVVSSANDSAVWSDEQQQIRQQITASEWNYLPEVRR